MTHTTVTAYNLPLPVRLGSSPTLATTTSVRDSRQIFLPGVAGSV